jgi:hypothetical protein
MTPAERKEFYHQRQLKAAATRRRNFGDSVFEEVGSLGGRPPKRKRKGNKPMQQK